MVKKSPLAEDTIGSSAQTVPTMQNRYNGPKGTANKRGHRVFTKLLKDESALVRNRNDAILFIEGVEILGTENAPGLLMKLDDKRHQGPRRIREILSFVGTVDDVDAILIRFLRHVMTEETARPLYCPLRNRVLTRVFDVPLLLHAICEQEAPLKLSKQSAGLLCLFLKNVSSNRLEARGNEILVKIAEQFHHRHDVDSRALRSLVLADAEMGHGAAPSDDRNQSVTSCFLEGKQRIASWVSDETPPGGRHDNDHSNFRFVRVLPTSEELRCESRPWLPLSNGANNFVNDGILRLLSNNFRLLREDAIFSMKQKIQAGHCPWQNTRIVDIDVSVQKGLVEFVVQCDPRKQKINWSLSRSLSHGTVVAFCRDKAPVLMGTISTRDLKWLESSNGPKFGVAFDAHGDQFNDALSHWIDGTISCKRSSLAKEAEESTRFSERRAAASGGFQLIEASSSFATYRPVLDSLQSMTDIPFVEELCEQERGMASSLELSYLPETLRMPQDKICNGFTMNVMSTSVEELCSATTLDRSQASALLHAFSNRVSLIQGPPGTGKTFIGGLIAKMLRDNTDESILCLCYTNHALDQFLEHMLDAGETRLVRIGSRTRSERVAKYNLRELARRKALRTRESTRRFKQVTAQMHAAKHAIDEGINFIQQPIEWRNSTGGVESYLLTEHPELHACLCLPEVDGGFDIVGPNSKTLKEDFLWKAWYRGDPFPSFFAGFMPVGLSSLNEFWSLLPEHRLAMANGWKKEIVKDEIKTFKRLVIEFQILCEERRTIKQQEDLQILEEARVIGATTTGAAQYKQLLSSKKPGVLIVEEAGEVLEPHVLASLEAESTRHLILIGDHKQLRPKVETYKLTSVSDMGYAFDCSLFERLISSGLLSVTLGVQHRMRPTISSLIRMQTYPDLIDHESVTLFPDVQGVKSNVLFLDHQHFEDKAEESDGDVPSASKSNHFEVDMCLSITKYLLQQGYRPGKIAILTPYLGQLQQIVRRVKDEIEHATAFLSEQDYRDLEDLEDRDVKRDEQCAQSLRCSSIDNFQGEEADIVLISLVRSNKHGNIGFLKEPQRVNVLLSRARIGMIIIGNSQTLRASKQGGRVWGPLLDFLNSKSMLQAGLPTTACPVHLDDEPILVSSSSEFRLRRPNGGCVRVCGQRMDCGHQCRLSCHPFDREHKSWSAAKCVEPCRRVPHDCPKNHACRKLCNEKCGPCTHNMGPIQLIDCEHWSHGVICHDIRNKMAFEALSMQCSEQVEYTFEACGHSVATACKNTKHEAPSCPAICEKLVSACGHTCTTICGQCEGIHKCNKACERRLFCGHFCGRACHSGDCPPCAEPCIVACVHSSCPKRCRSLCASCVEPCDWFCEHHGRCELACGAPCARLPCNERCSKKLDCGHRCPSICGENCPSVTYCQICCDASTQDAIVDHVMMASYREHDVNEDPLVVLPCGHFFATSTLDGHFGMSEVYQTATRDSNQYVSLKPLSNAEISEKPRTCPDCRSVAHSIYRFGRIFRLSELRALERKHKAVVDQELRYVSTLLEKDCESSADLINRVERLEKRILKSPMTKVRDSCADAKSLIEVPPPPPQSLIGTIELLGKVYARGSQEARDDGEKNAIASFSRGIRLAESSKSWRANCRLRLELVDVVTKRRDVEGEEKEEILGHLDWVMSHGSAFTELVEMANKMKEAILNEKKRIAEIMAAVSLAESGYNYGTSWSSHWFQCPNGHPYYIGECGGAMQESVCIECGEPTGGQNHALTRSNQQVGGIFADALHSEQ